MKTQLAAALLCLFFLLPGCGGHKGSQQSGSFRASSVSAGDYHACSLLPDGTVKCWGLNSSGQLGDASSVNALGPVQVQGITTATQVSAGGRHSCARLSDGTIRCWGANSMGQLGNSSTAGSFTPVTVSGITTATQVSAGEAHTCAVLTDGTVRCWGDNSYGQIAGVAISYSSTPVTVPGISTATEVSAGGAHTCAVLSDGTLRCWGSNTLGQLGDLSFITTATPVTVAAISTATGVSSGSYHTCSNLSDLTVRCWGDNSYGQLGVLWPTVGTSYVTTFNYPVQPFVTGVSKVAAGLRHTCAERSDGAVLCWGENAAGQLGNGNFTGFFPPGTTAPSTTTVNPVQAAGITSSADIGAGFGFSCSRLSDSRVYCWGDNSSGQLGNSTGISFMTPVRVTN